MFTYGTLQIPEVMAAVTGRRFRFEPATLRGYVRYRLIGRVYPGLRRRPGAATGGLLYRNVDRLSLARLDRFEDFFYRRQTLGVIAGSGGSVLADVYVIDPRYYRLLEPRRWSLQAFARHRLRRYLRRCRRRA